MTMEKTVSMKVAGVASAAMLLAGSGAALAVLPAEAATAPDTPAAAVAVDETAAPSARVSINAVEGQFAFTQDALTSNSEVSNVFAKAAAVLCASLPQYAVVPLADTGIVVTGPDGAVLGTVEDLAADSDGNVVIGCACASNAAGGGAIANVGVSGTTLASLVAAAAV